MTKAELSHEVAENSGLTVGEASEAVETVLGSIIEALNSGDKVEIRGFGSFRLRAGNPRQGRNTKTGELESGECMATLHLIETGVEVECRGEVGDADSEPGSVAQLPGPME